MVVQLLGRLFESDNLTAQLWCLRNLEMNAQALILETILGNEILIAYAHIEFYATRLWTLTIPGVEIFVPGASVILYYCFW